MKMIIFLLIIISSLLPSCSGPNGIIYEAVKKDSNFVKILIVYEDNQYLEKENNEIIEQGKIEFNKDTLKLFPNPTNPLNTLIISREFLIKNNVLCELMYESIKENDNMLITEKGIKVVSQNCYQIIK